ncbi:uncharacterized protein [Phyllobates terribilis]|uniref:uncharacterized protein n=1 Tax=Phyllobates terribilis TaxID=111132 RepID=UPI003CCADFC7
MSIADLFTMFFRTFLVFDLLTVKRRKYEFSADQVWLGINFLELIKNVEVAAIIGPETSMEAVFEISICDKAHVPLISYSATSPFLSSLESKYFIQAAQVDSAQVEAISSLVKAFGWRQIVPIFVDNDFGGGIIPSLIDNLLQAGTHVPYRSPISPSASNDQISMELNNLKSLSTRVFIVHMDRILGRRLFSLAREHEMLSKDYVWIVTNGIGNVVDRLTPPSIKDMQGVIGVRTYLPRTSELENFIFRWKRRMVKENQNAVDPQVTMFELWAYDSVTALARAIEKVGSSGFVFDTSNISSGQQSTDLSTLGVSRAGNNLIREMRSDRFKGLSGGFSLLKGKLKSSIMEIININGKGENIIGIWTPENGFLRDISSSNNQNYSISKDILGPIIWPGGQTDVPKGWVFPTNEKKLRILVPIKYGFDEFVKVTYDGINTAYSGFCIHLFKAITDNFSYPIPHEFFILNDTNKPVNYSYDELIHEVFLKKYDAIIGDVTILASRSESVDFTLPYLESGVVMIAPIDNSDKRLEWVFVKPFDWDLWLASFCSMVFFALVLWAVERTNPDLNNANDTLFYTFSMLVFAHGNKLSNNVARFLVIVWLIFILIITQSYTANLASMLTVKQLNSTVTGIRELVNSNQTVGYQEGSFVKDFLKHHNIINVKPYTSPQELDELLVKGSQNGGIAAAFDELPYVKVFLSTYCSKYMMVPPVYQAEGLGFAFQRGSPLVAEVSRQILKLKEGGQMEHIEQRLRQQRQDCPESSTAMIISSNRLKLKHFWELFSIVGSISIAGLIAFLISNYAEVSRSRVNGSTNPQPGSPTTSI